MKQEEFKDIEGYDGWYQIGDNGTVLSLRFGKVKTMMVCERGINNAYSSVALVNKAGVRRKWAVHRLVALTFVSGDTSLCVNHKDMNKLNNRADNLEWVTYAENAAHAFRNKPELFMSRKSMDMATPIIATSPEGVVINFRSLQQTCKVLGIKSMTALKCALVLGKRIKGYRVVANKPTNHFCGFGYEALFPCG